VNKDTATTIRFIKRRFLLSRGNHKAGDTHIQSAKICYSTTKNQRLIKVTRPCIDTEMSQANKVTDILSQEEKIKQLPRRAIEDIYARQLLLKVNSQLHGYTSRDSNVFKGLDMEDTDITFRDGVLNIDTQIYHQLQDKDGDLVDAVLDRWTKEVEGDKVEVMRQKLIITSECCGVPRARLCHQNVDAWAEIEGV